MIDSGKIKITNDGNIIMQFSNYHHIIDGDTELYYKHQVDKEISDLKRLNHDLCERVTENDEIRQHWEEIEQTRAENTRLKAKLAENDAEIAQLQAMLEERNKQVAELKSDIADLRDDKKSTDAILDERNAEIAELKERSQWHRQKDKDIYFECGKHWGAEYIIKMKDGTTHLAYGGCDEGGDGSVSTYFHLQEDDEWNNDYEWEYDDIDIWYEIPDHRIDGNIKEAK